MSAGDRRRQLEAHPWAMRLTFYVYGFGAGYTVGRLVTWWRLLRNPHRNGVV